jgi:hypothetical protein
MRILVAVTASITLAACDASSEANNALPNAPDNLITPPANEAQALSQWREDVVRGCVGGARESVGPEVPVEQHCACAADREMAGKTLAQLEAAEMSGDHGPVFQAALRACIAEISPGYRPGG